MAVPVGGRVGRGERMTPRHGRRWSLGGLTRSLRDGVRPRPSLRSARLRRGHRRWRRRGMMGRASSSSVRSGRRSRVFRATRRRRRAAPPVLMGRRRVLGVISSHWALIRLVVAPIGVVSVGRIPAPLRWSLPHRRAVPRGRWRRRRSAAPPRRSQHGMRIRRAGASVVVVIVVMRRRRRRRRVARFVRVGHLPGDATPGGGHGPLLLLRLRMRVAPRTGGGGFRGGPVRGRRGGWLSVFFFFFFDDFASRSGRERAASFGLDFRRRSDFPYAAHILNLRRRIALRRRGGAPLGRHHGRFAFFDGLFLAPTVGVGGGGDGGVFHLGAVATRSPVDDRHRRVRISLFVRIQSGTFLLSTVAVGGPLARPPLPLVSLGGI
mmetsp:Transcript_19362/g.56594  ORF Transcript_19362/g.56594 Transcript_19362/m.56594 type:complete len:378 (+) Transcript_19362:2546-3679(+)